MVCWGVLCVLCVLCVCVCVCVLSQVLDARHCWSDAGREGETTALLRPLRRTFQSYHFATDSRQPAWTDVPTFFVPPHTMNAVRAAAAGGVGANGSGVGASASLARGLLGRRGNPKQQHQRAAAVAAAATADAAAAAAAAVAPNKLAPFFTPYLFSDCCDTCLLYTSPSPRDRG